MLCSPYVSKKWIALKFPCFGRHIFLGNVKKLKVKKSATMRKKYMREKNACLRQKKLEAEKIHVCSGKKLQPKNVSSPRFTWTRFSVLLCWLKPAGDDWPAPLWSKITMQKASGLRSHESWTTEWDGWWAAKSHRGSVHDWEIYVTARASPLVDLQGVKKDGRSMWSLCQNLSRPSGPLVINETITKLQMTAAKNLSIAHYK